MKLLYQPLVIFLVILFSIGNKLNSQIVINEYSCSNINGITDNYNQHEDWFELYNNSAGTVNLSGYYISDKDTDPQKWQIPSGTTIAGNSYLMVFASGRDEATGGYLHPSFKLTQMSQEHIVLAGPTGTIIDILQLIPTQTNHSRGRTTDGATTMALFTTPTPNATNTGAKLNYANKPIFSHEAGLYTTAFNLTITSPDPNVTIRYTTNGDDPISTSTIVTGGMNISTTTIIRAKCFSSNTNIPASFIESNTYFINDVHTIPVLSIAGNEVDNLLGGSTGQKEGSFEYFSKEQVLIDESNGNFNKHGNDSWAYPQRGFDFICMDEYGYNYAIQDQVFRDSNRDKFQRLIIKAAANDNYPSSTGGAHIRDGYVHALSILGDLKMDERTYEPCIVYLNGQYWGVYEIREKADDHDYTDYYYNQGAKDLQYLKTWGGTWSEYGGPAAQTAWNELRTFILGNDMTIPANFDYVDSLYNWHSLIDYVVLNSYTVCSDWLNWNTAWWRGMNPNGDKKKWRYVLWDMDATFGHYINYTGIPDLTAGADPCNPEGLNNPGGQGHIPILNALMDNETFSQYYISRFIDLSNTLYSCEYMQYVLDSLISLIQPEMQRHVNKWGGTYAGWETNVQALKDFIDTRCIDLSDGMITCYDLTGPFDIMVKIQPSASGTVKINSIWPDNFPYTGTYYGDIDILLKAQPSSGFIFDHWEFLNHTASPGNDTSDVVLNLLTTDTIIAVFVNPAPFVFLGPDTFICEGTSFMLDAGNEGADYTWNDGSGNQTHIVNQAGTYSVVVDNLGFTHSDSITVDLIYSPSVDLGENMQICPNQTINLQPVSEYDNFIWQDNSTLSFFDATEPGIYWVEVSNLCGSDRDSVIINEGVSPDINLGPDLIIIPGETLYLGATAYGATYLWNDNSTSGSIAVTKPGTYWVIVTNSCGSVYDEITIDCDCEIDIPNSFTPNEDGINDIFVIDGSYVPEEGFHLLIFDRWGEMVFESKSKYLGWDGKINGKIVANSTTFTYILKYIDINGIEISHKGVLYLLK